MKLILAYVIYTGSHLLPNYVMFLRCIKRAVTEHKVSALDSVYWVRPGVCVADGYKGYWKFIGELLRVRESVDRLAISGVKWPSRST